MSVIRLANLGGLLPSVSPRALPENAAQKASNLLARTSEFRPLQTDVAVATSSVSNPKTLYRMARDANGAFTSDMAQNWKTNTAEVNYVKGQLNDDAKERTYYTYADGSQPPRVMDATGADKPLGVPSPASAPTGSVTPVYSYSPEARAAELAKARDAAVDAIRKSVAVAWNGAKFDPAQTLEHPGLATPGYMDIYDPAHPFNPDHAKVFRVFAVAGPNSTNVTTSFLSSVLTAQANPRKEEVGIEPYRGIFDPRLGGVYAKAAGVYAVPWAAAGQDVFVVPFYAYGRTYDFDLETVVGLFRAIKMPGTNGAKQLFTDDQSRAFLTQLKAMSNYKTGTRIKPLIDALAGATWQFHTTMDTGALSSIGYVVDKQAELKVLSDAIGAEYDKISNELGSMLDQFYFSNKIDAEVPPGIPRIIEDRFYVVTYVTVWDEESAPSPVSGMAELDQNDTVTGSPPNPPAGYGINRFRYYRTNTGNAGAAFQFVGEAMFSPASLSGGALTTIEDDKKSTELGEVCPTLTWQPPPFRKDSVRAPKGSNPYMRGLVALANGVNAGFFDNTVCFSESYIPYAWPVEYQITTAFPVVALGAFGQTAVVFHTGGVDYISGSDAASMAHDKNVSLLACAAARSIANASDGVCYASNKGICVADRNGIRLLTENHWTIEDWKKISPASIVGAVHDGTYFFTYNNGTPGCYALHIETGKLITLDVVASALYTDILTDQLYAVQGNSIKALFAGSTHRSGNWRSKITVLPRQAAFAWLVIESDFEAPITVRWYGDGVLRHTVAILTRAPVRLPAGRYLEHEIEVDSSARWTALTIASSTEELKQV